GRHHRPLRRPAATAPSAARPRRPGTRAVGRDPRLDPVRHRARRHRPQRDPLLGGAGDDRPTGIDGRRPDPDPAARAGARAGPEPGARGDPCAGGAIVRAAGAARVGGAGAVAGTAATLAMTALMLAAGRAGFGEYPPERVA